MIYVYQHLKRNLIILQRSYEKQMLSMEANTKNELKKMEKTFDTKLAANDLEVKKHEKLGMEKVRWVMEFLIILRFHHQNEYAGRKFTLLSVNYGAIKDWLETHQESTLRFFLAKRSNQQYFQPYV
jgi:hypothetical protein